MYHSDQCNKVVPDAKVLVCRGEKHTLWGHFGLSGQCHAEKGMRAADVILHPTFSSQECEDTLLLASPPVPRSQKENHSE